jgi:hypothetical protein
MVAEAMCLKGGWGEMVDLMPLTKDAIMLVVVGEGALHDAAGQDNSSPQPVDEQIVVHSLLVSRLSVLHHSFM